MAVFKLDGVPASVVNNVEVGLRTSKMLSSKHEGNCETEEATGDK